MASFYSSPSTGSTGFQLLSALLLWLLLLSRVDAQDQRDEVCTLFSFKGRNLHLPDAANRLPWRDTDENACAWVGVVCTTISTVLELDLSGWGWYIDNSSLGVLSTLTDLRILGLSSNNVPGSAEGIGDLTGLILLNLSSNALDTFPDLSSLTRFTLLDLSQNDMNGTIPPGILACRNLRSLSLHNKRLDGELPNMQGSRQLHILLLANNSFSGPFLQQLVNLTSLVTLDLSHNLFDGIIPSLPKLSNLANLILDYNNFTDFETDWSLHSNIT